MTKEEAENVVDILCLAHGSCILCVATLLAGFSLQFGWPIAMVCEMAQQSNRLSDGRSLEELVEFCKPELGRLSKLASERRALLGGAPTTGW
jgi:hypothetical protein